MDDVTKIEIDPLRTIRNNKVKQLAKLEQQQITDFVEIVARAYKSKKPGKEDLQKIRKFLREYPAMCPAVFGLAETIQDTTIKKMVEQEPARIAIEEHLVNIRNELGYHDAPIMEKLLIENIVTAWLRVQWLEYQLTLFMGREARFAELEFWERRLSMAQRRYLAACESLAKIRKMNIPALQLNIGNKQINVAGRVQATKNERAPEIIEGEVR
jgi:hypothetical protein